MLTKGLEFLETFAQVPPLFLPDTTPIYSNAGFQLLAFALAKSAGGKKGEYGDVLRNTILKPLGMAQSGLLGEKGVGGGSIFGEGLDASAPGEQGYGESTLPFTLTISLPLLALLLVFVLCWLLSPSTGLSPCSPQPATSPAPATPCLPPACSPRP